MAARLVAPALIKAQRMACCVCHTLVGHGEVKQDIADAVGAYYCERCEELADGKRLAFQLDYVGLGYRTTSGEDLFYAMEPMYYQRRRR